MTTNILSKRGIEFLGVIQTDFPVTERPFAEVANRLGWTEKEVIDSLHTLMHSGIVRAFGPVFEPRKLGYKSTLIAAKVESERVAEIAAAMLDIREITHNYLRDHELNLWFTLTARSQEIIDDIVLWFKKFTGVKKVLDLPILKVYKISAVFDVNLKSHANRSFNDFVRPMNESEKNIVRTIQNDFPIAERPFQIIAEASDSMESEIIETVNRWLGEGTIRRFGARINHRRVGYTANTLAVWGGLHIDIWGKKFAELPEVTHCYRRKPHTDWPKELYTMIHAKTDNDTGNLLARMRSWARGAHMESLKTISELKKTSMKYFLEEE